MVSGEVVIHAAVILIGIRLLADAGGVVVEILAGRAEVGKR